MPIYEYQCQSCGQKLEKLQRLSDPALTDCPACNQSELKRLVSAAAFRLKGSGWYETDFKKGSKKNLHDSGESGEGASKSDASEAKSGEKSSAAKSSETKPKSKESGTAPGKKTDAA